MAKTKNTSFRYAMIIACVLCISLYTSAQPRPYKKQIEQIESYHGNIIQWKTDRDYVYDAFMFETDDKTTILVKFPSFLGQDIKDLGNNDLSIKGFLRKNRNGNNITLQLLSISSGEKNVSRNNGDHRMRRSHYRNPTNIQGNGKIQKIIYNDRNDPVAYLLANDTLLKMPPHIFKQINNVAKVDTEINYEGLERKLNAGELQEKRKIIIHARAIEINGTRYFIQ